VAALEDDVVRCFVAVSLRSVGGREHGGQRGAEVRVVDQWCPVRGSVVVVFYLEKCGVG